MLVVDQEVAVGFPILSIPAPEIAVICLAIVLPTGRVVKNSSAEK